MEHIGFPSHRVFSVRSILTFAIVVVVTALLLVTFGSHSAHAATDASWSGDSIVYDNHGYNKADNFKDATGTIPSGSVVYTTPTQTIEGSSDKKVFVLYFTPGVDPPTATTVKYIEFNVSSSNVTSNPQNARDPSLTQKGQEDQGSSCSVEGIGWIVCPVSTFVARGMDLIFTDVLAPMIAVQPTVLGDTNNSMFQAWSVMRNIANVAFVIVFLIIIYSQLTNFGVSNYGLKKLIPRLIVAAVLVNVSYIIAAIAIDASNILGYSIQSVFESIRKSVFHMTNENVSGLTATNWTNVAAAALGVGGVVGGIFYVANAGAWVLIPVLLGVFAILILVVVVLAARQAIIVILVIIAPIAFVANLLPNTEKWFDKWKDLFLTMLIFFPAFSLVFGGSQLAGQLIMQNSNGNIVTLIFGLAVQVAPLVITPILLKFSGGLLGKIAQITNNPSKGLLDRSKNWAKERGELTKRKSIANGPKLYNPGSWGAGMVRSADFRKRRLQDRTNAFKQEGDNLYHASTKYGKIHDQMDDAEIDKKRIEEQHGAHLQSRMSAPNSKTNIKTLELERAKTSAERATAQTNEMLSGYRANTFHPEGTTGHLAALQREMAKNVIETAAWKQGEQNNQYAQQRAISTQMRTDANLLNIAEGYGDADMKLIGRERAQSSAVATLAKLNKDARDNTITLMETEAVEAKMSVKDFAIQKVITGAMSDKLEDRVNIHTSRLEAALEIAAADGQITVFDDARANRHINQDLVDAVVARNVGNFKSKGGFHIQADPKLSLQRYIEDFTSGKDTHGAASLTEVENVFVQDQKMARLSSLSNTNSDQLGGIKHGAFKRLAEDIVNNNLLGAIPRESNGELSTENAAMVQQIFSTLRVGLKDPSTRASFTDRETFARNIEEAVRSQFFPDQPVLNLSDEERAIPGGGTRPASTEANFPLETPSFDSTEDAPDDDADD